MARTNFSECMRHVLVHEGGKVDHPKDPGGRTNQGVTQRVYDAYRANVGLPRADVYLMQPNERDAIYRLQYWQKIRGDLLPVGVDYVVFDGAVNSGPAQSIKWLQRCIPGLKVDGMIGEATIRAVINHPNHDALIQAICDRRMAFLRALPTFGTFGRGWTGRVNGVLTVGQAMASGERGPAAVPAMFFGSVADKAEATDVSLPSGSVGVGTAGASATLLATLSDVKMQLYPFLGQFAGIDKVYLGLTVVIAAAGIGGAAYAFYANRKRKRMVDALDLPVAA